MGQRKSPPHDEKDRNSQEQSLWRPMHLWEAYVVFTIVLWLMLVLAPAVDAALEVNGAPPRYPAITAMLPRGPGGLVVVLIYAATAAAPLTLGVCGLRQLLPRRSVWLATMLILAAVIASWTLCAH
jgi:hypothetical protein